MQWSLTAVEVEGHRMGVIVARLMTGDLVEARNRAEMFPAGDLFSRWLAALGQTLTLTALRESGLLVKPSGLTDLVIHQSVRLRTRLSTFAHPVGKVPLASLVQRFALLGPRCTPEGDLAEDPADFYAQVIVALATEELPPSAGTRGGGYQRRLGGCRPTAEIVGAGQPPTDRSQMVPDDAPRPSHCRRRPARLPAGKCHLLTATPRQSMNSVG